VALLSTNHKCTHPCLLLLRSKRCEAVEDGVYARRMQPQSIACGVGTSVSRIELYNSNRIVSLFMFLYGYYYCYSLMSTICMKLDPGMHIGMHLVCFSKTGCDSCKTPMTILRKN
jgi:hypothetical protein